MSSKESEGSLLGNCLILAICAAFIVAALVYLANEAEKRGLSGTYEFDKDWSGFIMLTAWLTTGGIIGFVMLVEGIRRIGVASSHNVFSLAMFLIVIANVSFSAWITGVLT